MFKYLAVKHENSFNAFTVKIRVYKLKKKKWRLCSKDQTATRREVVKGTSPSAACEYQ